MQVIVSTGLFVRSVPPAASNAASRASGTCPLPPTGRPTVPTWRMAWGRAPSPVPGVSGEIPHTIGPVRAPGPVMASSVKNERSTSAALRRDQRIRVVAPLRRRRRASLVRPAIVGGSEAASNTISMAGMAALA